MREITMNDCILLLGAGIFWFYSLKKEKREELVRNLSWNVLNKYYTYKIKMTNMMVEYGFLKEISEMEEEDEQELDDNDIKKVEKDIYIHEHEIKENGVISTLYNYDDSIDYLEDNLYFMGMEKNNKIYYKRLKSEQDKMDKINPVSKPFMQIEYKDKDNKIEIQNEILNYYVEGNVILDYDFVKFIMKENYGIDILDDYEIIILDENVKMLTIKKNEYVLVIDDEDENYKLCKN